MGRLCRPSGNSKQDWFKKFLELPHGIPSHDTFGRVFGLIDPEEFRHSFLTWVQTIQKLTQGEVVAIDGKQLHGSEDEANGRAAIDMVSAWATVNQLVLGQVKVDDKSNEIPAIPRLLELLDITGCLVTIDAIATQTEIAKMIVERGGDYLLPVKENQGQLYEDLEKLFSIEEQEGFITRISYLKISYNKRMLNPAQKASLSALFPAGRVLTDSVSRLAYELDAGPFPGLPDAVIILKDFKEAQQLVEWAAANHISLVGRGAGTGLTGGAVASQGGVVASFSRMNAIQNIDEDSRTAIVEPGVVNQVLQQRLAPLGLVYPPDPASYAVSTIGGNVAENAGGPHCLKYGVTGNYVQALEVVLADGRCLWLGSQAVDPPEYDFASLVTGSEGTLAFITKVALRLRRHVESVKTLTASFADVAVAGQAVSAVIAAGLTPATIELMDHNMINIVEDYLGLGLLRQAAALLIFDVEGYPESLDAQLDGVAEILSRYTPLEVKIARTAEERERLWLGRRNASGATARISPSEYVLDVCVPRSRLAEALREINAIAARYQLPVTYLAHAGDGNLHPGLLCDLSKEDDQRRVHQAGEEILSYCAQIGGSIGGEHGIGIEKRAAMAAMYGPGELAAMRQVKQVFDPQDLFNPGKIFPAESEPAEAAATASGAPPGSLFEPRSSLEPLSSFEPLSPLSHSPPRRLRQSCAHCKPANRRCNWPAAANSGGGSPGQLFTSRHVLCRVSSPCPPQISTSLLGPEQPIENYK